MSTQLQTVTAEELLAMPRGRVRRELVRGEVREMPLAGHEHGRIAMTSASKLARQIGGAEVGVVYAAGTGFKLASVPDTVRAPDVAFVRRQRLEQIGEAAGYFPGAPDLAVEVVSPGDRFTEVEEKVFEWLEAGTRMVVVLNPAQRTATIYRSRNDIAVLTEDDTLDGADVVPGWSVRVAEFFE